MDILTRIYLAGLVAFLGSMVAVWIVVVDHRVEFQAEKATIVYPVLVGFALALVIATVTLADPRRAHGFLSAGTALIFLLTTALGAAAGIYAAVNPTNRAQELAVFLLLPVLVGPFVALVGALMFRESASGDDDAAGGGTGIETKRQVVTLKRIRAGRDVNVRPRQD
jgi:hypothetical protein